MILQNPRNIVSPRPGKKWDSKAPTVPGETHFEAGLDQVKDAVRAAETGQWPAEIIADGNPTDLDGEVPDLLKKKLRLVGRRASRNLAMSVSMDKPWHLGEFLLDELLAQGATYKVDRPGTIQFCDMDASYCRVMMRINQAYAIALDRVFDIKYAWEQPRPEDYLEIHPSIFSVDGYGAPGHWSYGAGHAAAARAMAWVIIQELKLTADQIARILHACWVFAQGRTLLGVHFVEDNKEGWRAAESVLAEKMPLAG